MSIRWAAQELAARMGKEVTFTGTESETALLNNAAKSHQLFGYPKVTLRRCWTGPRHGCNRAARAGISRLTSKRKGKF